MPTAPPLPPRSRPTVAPAWRALGVAVLAVAPLLLVILPVSQAHRARAREAEAQRLAAERRAARTLALGAATQGVADAAARAMHEGAAVAHATRRAALLGEGARPRAIRVAETTVAYRDLWVTVGPNDTWQSIAAAFGHTGSTLAALNPETDLNHLHPGQRILAYRYHDALPSVSRGRPNYGRLVRGMPMPDGPHWTVRDRHLAFGTGEAVSHLLRGLSHVGETMPGGARPMIGDLSRRRGGRLKRHRSHRTGRDADVAYYFLDHQRSNSFWPAWPSTMDKERQWALFRYWLERDLVTYIFIDPRLQRALYDHAVSLGEDPELLARAFGERNRGRSGILRYSPGHRDHFHVRFHCADHDSRCSDL